jgi:hypothetical protein
MAGQRFAESICGEIPMGALSEHGVYVTGFAGSLTRLGGDRLGGIGVELVDDFAIFLFDDAAL